MSRRQNSSCDQCRKGKRACDAVWLRDRQIQRAAADGDGLGPSQGGGLDDDFDFAGPCTNCARTNKQCTFEWVQSQQLQRKERQQTLGYNNASHAPAAAANRQATNFAAEIQSVGSQSPAPSNIPLRPLRPSIPQFDSPQHHHHHHHHHHQQQQQPYATYPQQHAAEQQILLDGCGFPNSGPEQFDVPAAGADISFVDGSLTTSAPPLGLSGVPCLSLDNNNGMHHPTQPPFMNAPNVMADYGLAHFTGDGYGGLDGAVPGVWPSPTTSVATTSAPDMHQPTHKRRRTQSPSRCVVPTPWDITGENRLARLANGNMIGKTMMKIYHDVMEGALSCWLTEQTCPYNSVVTSSNSIPNHLQQQQQSNLWDTFEDLQRNWGPNWSNRIYRRVIKLDRMAHLLGLRHLGPADERKVSSALNAAVMAFTAQWAQASQRSSARWPPAMEVDEDHVLRPPDLELGDEFDRTLQKGFWNQARKALDECGEIDSFRVVFAEIIFGLTQKYGEELAPRDHDSSRGDRGGETTSQVVDNILREDRQQVWLERATRRLYVLRRRVELYDRQLRNTRDGEDSCYDAECRKTVDLLFWLAVMFDTISAAMTERPLTVSDEDSSNLGLAHPSHHDACAPATLDTAKRWNVILAKDQQTKLTALRWPCTDAEIAQELTEAAPVKVLLYRKVTGLQTLIARDMDAPTIEEAIEDSLMVYRHWQAIYSGLFVDCIENHLMLSARIQSWYVCLSGHWLLATLLLVDLVEIVDQRGMADGPKARKRMEEGTFLGMRRHSTKLVSDLARVSTPRHDEYGELENFHHAISEGALLTEPWTMILIRAFSRASIILLEEHDTTPIETHGEMTETSAEGERGNLARCENCVKALWYLGRKSDMAREVADVLADALQRATTKAGLS